MIVLLEIGLAGVALFGSMFASGEVRTQLLLSAIAVSSIAISISAYEISKRLESD